MYKIQRIGAALLLGGLSSLAMAQETKPLGLSIRGGAVFPLNSTGRNEGKNWFGAGFEYALSNVRMGGMENDTTAHFSISVDFYGKGDLTAVPILFNYCAHNKEFYYTVGAGVAFTRDFDLIAGARNRKNKTNIAYQAGVGYNFQRGSNPLFVEAKFFGNTASALNVVGVYLGIRL